GGGRVVQRLYPDAVSSQQEGLAALVPNREGEHPSEVSDAVGAILLVQVNDRLGIAGSAESVPPRRKLLLETPIVVDLAVLNDPDGPVLVGNRLVPPLQIDDAEPAHADTDMSVHILAVVVGSAMRQLVTEPSHGGRGHTSHCIGVHDTGNATHVV